MSEDERGRVGLVIVVFAYQIGELAQRANISYEEAEGRLEKAEKLAREGTPHIVCPHCGRVSCHPEDIAQKYCNGCHQFHEFMGLEEGEKGADH